MQEKLPIGRRPIADIMLVLHNRAMKVAYILSRMVMNGVAVLSGTAGLATPLQAPPPPALEIVDPNSDALQKSAADELRSARETAARSQSQAVKKFAVGWEMHHGYYLNPVGNFDVYITPDFMDSKVVAAFDATMRQDVLVAHIGERLECDCTGMAWKFYSQPRFIVRSAIFRWVKSKRR